MDATHIHLILSHFPIVGTIIGVMILAYGQISKNIEIQKVALLTFILMALFTIPVFLTGEGAEESIEDMAGISKNLIHNHEELAEKAIWLMGVLGVLSLISFFAIIKKLSFAKTITLVTFIVSIATCGVFAQVGNLGGQIRHSEIRDAGAANQVNTDTSKANEHGDDD